MNWQICKNCKGNGSVDGIGAFGSEELDEWFGSGYEERDEFLENYRNGMFRNRCDVCTGTGKVFYCPDCNLPTAQAFTLDKARCYDCHTEARSWNVREDYAGEHYWDD